MKKIIITVFILVITVYGYSFPFDNINGAWVNDEFYKLLVTEKKKIANRLLYEEEGFNGVIDDTLIISINNSEGLFLYSGLAPQRIINIRINSQSNISFQIRYADDEMHDSNMPEEEYYVSDVSIIFVNNDAIIIESEYNFLYCDGKPWHRISGPAKIKPQPGKINDSRVRIRTKPELNSDTWGFLNKSEKVSIIDKSSEKQKIGDMESYWYKVQTEGYPDGWVYGAYIDVE